MSRVRAGGIVGKPAILQLGEPAVFVQEYLVDLNATQAAIRAKYSEDAARQIGSENLAKPDIAAAIQEAMDARATRTVGDYSRPLGKVFCILDRRLRARGIQKPMPHRGTTPC